MKAFFLALFFFLLGYDAGPLFRNSVRKSGIKVIVKFVVMSLFFCGCVFGCGFLITRIFGFASSQANGVIPGSQTQLLLPNVESDVIAYSLTFMFATVGMVVFVQKAAPLLIGMDLISAVKDKIGVGNTEHIESESMSMPVQIRAYRVDSDSPYGGKTIDELEADYEGRLQIESVYRDGVELELKQSQVVHDLDVIVVVGSVRDIDLFDNQGLTETTEEEYISFDMAHLDIVISEKRVENILYKLSDKGILIQKICRKGKEIAFSDDTAVVKGDILSVAGRPHTIVKCIEKIGYIKEEGDIADVPLLLLAIALAIPFGMIAFPGTTLTLGTSCCALIIGMIVGCIHDSKPKIGYIPTGARWLLKNIGLNLFFAATALERALPPKEIFVVKNLYVVVAGVILTIIPAVLAVLFGRWVLRLAPADILGGLCGCTTSTPALNSLTEVTGSTVFTVGYTPAYVTSLVSFVMIGSILLPMI